MRARHLPLFLALLATTTTGAAAQARNVETAFHGLGLSPALVRIAASGDEAAARRLIGAPDSVGSFETHDGSLTDGLLYRRAGYEIYVLFCTPETRDSWGCGTESAPSRPIYEVLLVREALDATAAREFERHAHHQLEAIARRRWVECDMPNYDLSGGATASVGAAASGRISTITLFRTPPPRSTR